MDDDDDPDPSPHFHAPLSSLLFSTSDASDDDVAAPSSLPPRHDKDPLGHPAAGPCLLAFGLVGSQRDCGDFDAKGVLKCGEDYEEAKLIKPLGHDGAMGGESSLVGMQVEVFYPENPKWYDSPGGLDHSGDSGDDRFRHGGLV